MPSSFSPSETIDQIVNTTYGHLKPLGYRRVKRTLYRVEGDVYRCVNFQGDKWNRRDRFGFTINLVITTPLVHEAYFGRKFPSNPASAEPVLNQRIGWLMPESRDVWWEITPATDLRSLTEEVQAAVMSYAIPFLDRHRTVEDLIETLANPDSLSWTTDFHRRLLVGILLWKIGEKERARNTFTNLIRGARFEEARSVVVKVAASLGAGVSVGLRLREPRSNIQDD